jgi:hypothetical protein
MTWGDDEGGPLGGVIRRTYNLVTPRRWSFELLDYLPDGGFEVDEVRRSKWRIVERLRAHKPT